MPMIDCSGVSAGVNSLACISAATNYVPGYVFLVLLAAVLFYRLGFEDMRSRFSATLLVVSLVSAMGAVGNTLFPNHFFIVGVVGFIGSLVLLVIRK